MRKEKKLLLDEVKELIDGSIAMIVTKYDKLKPKDSWNLSRSLSESESSFKVLKKRIFQMAAKELGYTFEKEELGGHIGVVFVKGDPLKAAKAVLKFDVLEIIKGQIEGKTCSCEEVKLLAKLPGKDGMRAEILGLFEAPYQGVVSVMNNMLSGLLYCLQNKLEKKG